MMQCAANNNSDRVLSKHGPLICYYWKFCGFFPQKVNIAVYTITQCCAIKKILEILAIANYIKEQHNKIPPVANVYICQ